MFAAGKIAIEPPPKFLVEGLGTTDVRHRYDDHFQFHVHIYDSNLRRCERALGSRIYPAGSESGGALFVETPNELGAAGSWPNFVPE
jgi:hypothetical protein